MTDVVTRLQSEDDAIPDTWAGGATVTDADAGVTTDGRRLIEIRWNGATSTAPYLASYTPVLGEVVSFIKVGASVLVLGAPATT